MIFVFLLLSCAIKYILTQNDAFLLLELDLNFLPYVFENFLLSPNVDWFVQLIHRYKSGHFRDFCGILNKCPEPQSSLFRRLLSRPPAGLELGTGYHKGTYF